MILISCQQPNNSSSEDDVQNPIPRDKAKYTVMLYGCGGGNLDEVLLNNLNQEVSFFQDEANKDCKINMVAQFNMSDYDSNNKLLKYQSSPNSPFRGTMRWFIEEGRWNRTYNFEEVQTLHNPKILTDFINWSKTYFPAEKYVLILSDHGDIFSIQDQPVDSEVTTINGWDEYRSCVDDYNLGNENIPLSVFGIEEGIKNSGVKMDLIYFDCCLTGQIESLYQLKNQTNFILCYKPY